MTTPDLAALRALVEAAQLRRNTGLRPLDEFMSPDDWVVIPHADFDEVRAALPAAQEALKRVDDLSRRWERLGEEGALASVADTLSAARRNSGIPGSCDTEATFDSIQ